MGDKNRFCDGYQMASHINSDAMSLAVTDATSTEYLMQLDEAIKSFAQEMNAKAGNNNPSLFGYTDEIWHKGTFYIDAISKRTGESGIIPNAHPFASADFAGSWGELYQLKDYRTAQASAMAQSITYNQEYNKYLAELSKQGKPLISKEQFLIDRSLDPDLDMNLPIYEAQTRLIPSDQLQDAIKALKNKILSEPREEQRFRYEDTLNKLVDRINSPGGASSVPLTREDRINLAKLAKEGKFDPKQYDITLAQKADRIYVLQSTLMSGLSAAIVNATLKAAPNIANCLIDLIKEGKIVDDDLINLGNNLSEGSKDGFIRGIVLSSIKNACNLGHLGKDIQDLSLNVAESATFNGILVVVTSLIIETTRESIMLCRGEIDRKQFEYNLSKRIYVSTFSVLGGVYIQSVLPTAPIIGYLIGSFVGSTLGILLFEIKEKVFISLSIKYGITYFGIVKQDYSLPDWLLKELGFETFDYEDIQEESFDTEQFELESFNTEYFQPEHFDMHFLRRGLIGVRTIGYITSH